MRYLTGLFILKVWKNVHVPLSEEDSLIWYKTWLNFQETSALVRCK